MLKKKAHKGVTALAAEPGGIAIARIARGGSAEPVLELCDFHPLEPGDDHSALYAALARDHHLDRDHCFSVIEPGASTLLLIEAPQVDPTELRAAVRWKVKDLIDFHIDDAVIDVFDIPAQESRGRQRMMYAVVSRSSTVREHIDRLESNDIGLSVIDIPEMAMRNVAALLPEDSGGVAMLYLTRSGGLMTITRGGELYLARTLDRGMDSLHQLNIGDSFPGAGGEEEEAFILEDEEGNPIPTDAEMPSRDTPLPPPLLGALDAIVLEIQRSLDYYESHFSLPSVSGLVVVPQEEGIPGMVNYLGANLGVPVRLLDLNTLIETPETLPDPLQAQCLLAVGAALREEAGRTL